MRAVLGAGILVIAWMLLSGIMEEPATGFYADMVFNTKAEKRGMPPVIFPHWAHRAEFKCKVCHAPGMTGSGDPPIFEMRSGSNDVDMDKIVNKGLFCGRCHNGEIAWKPVVCSRCHAGKPGMATGTLHASPQ